MYIFSRVWSTVVTYLHDKSWHDSPTPADVCAPSVESLDHTDLGADAERVPLDDELHHLLCQQQPVLTHHQNLGILINGHETLVGQLLEQLHHFIALILIISINRHVSTLVTAGAEWGEWCNGAHNIKNIGDRNLRKTLYEPWKLLN